MYIQVDLNQLPVQVRLLEPDDFASFKMVVVAPAHSWVNPAELRLLADRPLDAAWNGKLADLLQFAESKGWLDGQGNVRAHIEVVDRPAP